MKPHHILKTFTGSHTGIDHDTFEKGTTRDLSDSLAAIAVKEGWAKPADAAQVEESEPQAPAEERETKVEAPEETKPVKKGKK